MKKYTKETLHEALKSGEITVRVCTWHLRDNKYKPCDWQLECPDGLFERSTRSVTSWSKWWPNSQRLNELRSRPAHILKEVGDHMILKVLGVFWLVLMFIVLFKSFVRIVNENGVSQLGGFMAILIVWGMVGVFPIVIIKIGWRYL